MQYQDTLQIREAKFINTLTSAHKMAMDLLHHKVGEHKQKKVLHEIPYSDEHSRRDISGLQDG